MNQIPILEVIVAGAVGLAVFFVISSATVDGLPPLVVAWGGLVVGGVALGCAIAVGHRELDMRNSLQLWHVDFPSRRAGLV